MLKICGHHVFNIIWAYGTDRDHLGDETNDFRKIFGEVMDNPSVEIEVIIGVDDVCGLCKSNADGKCQAYDGTVPDRKAIRKLGLKAGDMKKWSDLVKLVADRVQSEEDFLDIFSQEAVESRFAYFKGGIEKFFAQFAGMSV
ncbi:MAG: DUF1284 domain-containing protein [Phycisphaerae bacterium]|nr:DUF1284 domain-containing protein [Phycisphaerae bacterium]